MAMRTPNYGCSGGAIISRGPKLPNCQFRLDEYGLAANDGDTRAVGTHRRHTFRRPNMRKLLWAGAIAMWALSFSLGGCDMMPADHSHMHESMWAGVTKAVAVLQPTSSNSVKGVIWFD